MRGRQENDKKTEIKLQKKINDCDIIKRYYYSLSDKTAKTKEAYLNHIFRLFDYFSITNENELKEIKPSDINIYINEMRMQEHSQSWLANIYYGIVF